MLVFVGPHGVRSGWRVLLFLVLTIILTGVAALALRGRGFGSDTAMLLQQATGVAAAGLATWIASRVEHRGWQDYGFGPVYRWRNLVSGMAAGFTALALLMALLYGAGFYRLARGPMQGAELAKWALYWAAVFVCVGLAEESLMRGYPMHTLARGIGFWPAALIVAVLFGLGHIGNRGEEVVGIANACLAGVVFAYTVRWTGSLWWAIGCHISWDWAETFFFGVADSGVPARHSWMLGTPAGPAWLSGGTVGPEGSVFAAAALLALAVAARYTAPCHHSAGLDRLPTPPASAPSEILPPASEESASRSMYSADSDDTN